MVYVVIPVLKLYWLKKGNGSPGLTYWKNRPGGGFSFLRKPLFPFRNPFYYNCHCFVMAGRGLWVYTSIMLNSGQNDAVSDTTKADSSNTAHNKKLK
jgi:hypothetical protein